MIKDNLSSNMHGGPFQLYSIASAHLLNVLLGYFSQIGSGFNFPLLKTLKRQFTHFSCERHDKFAWSSCLLGLDFQGLMQLSDLAKMSTKGNICTLMRLEH